MEELSEQRIWQARPGLLYRALVDGGMIYDGDRVQVHHLNASASLIWECCQIKVTEVSLAAALCGRYEVGEAQAQVDVRQILQVFADAGLLRS